ncbi:unnamed protein product [Hydatigera taeniaeformis]|uniref:Glyco_hydro_38N domain-containing protein n=1 Tax=Hydatigena taeniaeformis TaxID=6205 RepID=A0A0R3WW83_HYDTA|nr:unnamed protein product [Hydatigera taeniaeformis]
MDGWMDGVEKQGCIAPPSLLGQGLPFNLQVAYSFEDEYLDPTYIDGLRRHHLSQLIVELSNQEAEYGHTRPLPKQVRLVEGVIFLPFQFTVSPHYWEHKLTDYLRLGLQAFTLFTTVP